MISSCWDANCWCVVAMRVDGRVVDAGGVHHSVATARGAGAWLVAGGAGVASGGAGPADDRLCRRHRAHAARTRRKLLPRGWPSSTRFLLLPHSTPSISTLLCFLLFRFQFTCRVVAFRYFLMFASPPPFPPPYQKLRNIGNNKIISTLQLH